MYSVSLPNQQILNKKTSVEALKHRSAFAKKLGRKLSGWVTNGEWNSRVQLILWHGSLPRRENVTHGDVDFAVFLKTKSPQKLVTLGCKFAKEASLHCGVGWRNDFHFDAISMFEAHTHWDSEELKPTHIGVHMFRSSLLSELTSTDVWLSSKKINESFYLQFEAWSRFSHFYRHWIFEGIPIYDPDQQFPFFQSRDYKPEQWFIGELAAIIIQILNGYSQRAEGACTRQEESYYVARRLLAGLAYAIERNRPMGRPQRWISDTNYFKNRHAKQILMAAATGKLFELANSKNLMFQIATISEE